MSTLQDIKELFFKNITENNIIKIIFSNPIEKNEKFQKIILLIETNQNKKSNEHSKFQFSMFFGAQVKHENFSDVQLVYEKISEILETGYKQIDVISSIRNFKVLINKNYVCKIIYDKTFKVAKETVNLNHDKEKNYILKQGEKIDWLIKLGIMTKEFNIVNSMQKKFRQINRFLELIDDINKYIPENAFIVDFGCGKSYLTFAIYYYFNILQNKNVTIVGLDLKEEVVNNCQQLADEFHYTNLSFMTKDIKEFNHDSVVDMVITLHACDTATDYAIYNAVKWKSKIIMSVPCCQHQLNPQIKNEILAPILDYGILKDRFASILTDGIRAMLLEVFNYKTQVIEFIDMEHTPKNIMIRAIRKNSDCLNEKKLEEFMLIKDSFNVTPKLYELYCKGLE